MLSEIKFKEFLSLFRLGEPYGYIGAFGAPMLALYFCIYAMANDFGVWGTQHKSVGEAVKVVGMFSSKMAKTNVNYITSTKVYEDGIKEQRLVVRVVADSATYNIPDLWRFLFLVFLYLYVAVVSAIAALSIFGAKHIAGKLYFSIVLVQWVGIGLAVYVGTNIWTLWWSGHS